jgi:hypothetical protein
MFILNAHALWLVEFEPPCLCCSKRQSIPYWVAAIGNYRRPACQITMQGRSVRQSNVLFLVYAIFGSVHTQIRTQIIKFKYIMWTRTRQTNTILVTSEGCPLVTNPGQFSLGEVLHDECSVTLCTWRRIHSLDKTTNPDGVRETARLFLVYPTTFRLKKLVSPLH